jgi:hypothetical protein
MSVVSHHTFVRHAFGVTTTGAALTALFLVVKEQNNRRKSIDD